MHLTLIHGYPHCQYVKFQKILLSKSRGKLKEKGQNMVDFECQGLKTVGWHHRSSMETPEVFCGLKHFTHSSI